MKTSVQLVLSIALAVSTGIAGCASTCVSNGFAVVCGYDDGYYYDSLISGVTYETPTEDGGTRTSVTGENDDPGLFRYRAGEMVTFSLGATQLGQSLGKTQVTPFDIAGMDAEAVGDCEVDESALPEGRFRIVHNLAVLLQTLDGDGDPDNGIEIGTEIAALFDTVNVELDQPWETFRTDTGLQGVLDAANNQTMFPETRTLRDRVAALRALYRALDLCP